MEAAIKKRQARWRIFGPEAESAILKFWQEHKRNPVPADLSNNDLFKNANHDQLKNKIANLMNKQLPSGHEKETEAALLTKICTPFSRALDLFIQSDIGFQACIGLRKT